MRVEPPDLKPYFQTLHDLDGVLDWEEFFGNSNPVEIDVGSNRGLFLVNSGLANPDVNYLGLELDFKEARRSARRLQKREMSNVRVLGGDAKLAFQKLIAPHSVAAVHVYFPDPWWKRRHKRRRVFTDEFVDLVADSLIVGGYLHSWTDVAEYFEVINALMQHHPQFRTLPAPVEQVPEHDLDYLTRFERKKRKEGETIHRGLWQYMPQ